MPYKLSPSTLSLLKDCPRCFWLQFNRDIKRPAGIFPSLPSGMDSVLKKHFDSFIGTDSLPPELKELKDVKLFSDIEKLNVWRSNFRGISWTDDEGNILKGAVDNILVKDRKLIVLDYKTRGFPLKEDTADHYQDQMDIYNFLLRKNGYETEDYAYLLFYYPNTINRTGEVMFNTNLVKMSINVSNAETIFNNALTILNGPIPDSSSGCEYCRWGREIRGV